MAAMITHLKRLRLAGSANIYMRVTVWLVQGRLRIYSPQFLCQTTSSLCCQRPRAALKERNTQWLHYRTAFTI